MSTSKAWCMGIFKPGGAGITSTSQSTLKRDKRRDVSDYCQDTLLMRLYAALEPQMISRNVTKPLRGPIDISRHANWCEVHHAINRRLYILRHSTQGIILFAHTNRLDKVLWSHCTVYQLPDYSLPPQGRPIVDCTFNLWSLAVNPNPQQKSMRWLSGRAQTLPIIEWDLGLS